MKIKSTAQVSYGALKMVIYGKSGVGKTTLAKTIKEPTLIISSEAGLLSLAGTAIDVIDIAQDDNGVSIPKEKRIDRLGEAYAYVSTKEAQDKYKWIFIDSLSELSQNMVEQLQKEFPERKDSLVLYGENSKRMRSLIKSFRDLPYYNVVFTALAEDDQDDNKRRIVSISMVGNIKNTLAGYFDEFLYMDMIGEERVIYTQPSDKFQAKDRSGRLEKTEKPDLSLIANKIRGSKPVVLDATPKPKQVPTVQVPQSAITKPVAGTTVVTKPVTVTKAAQADKKESTVNVNPV